MRCSPSCANGSWALTAAGTNGLRLKEIRRPFLAWLCPAGLPPRPPPGRSLGPHPCRTERAPFKGDPAAVPGLALPGRPAADHAARPLPGPAPVSKAFAENVLEELDVGLEPRQDLLALLRAQRLALAAVPLQVTLERAGQGGRGPAGDQGAHRGGGPLRERHHAVGQRRLRVRRDVVPRYLGQHAGLYAQEGADPVQALQRLVDQQPVT